MRGDFLLDREVAYLNHGGYGACTGAVFEEYQRFQLELERGPTDVFTRRIVQSAWARRGSPACCSRRNVYAGNCHK